MRGANGRGWLDEPNEHLGDSGASGIRLKLGQGPATHQSPLVEQTKSVAKAFRLVQLVGREDHRLAFTPEVADELHHDLATQDIQSQGRLIQEENGGTMNQRPGQVHTLLLPRTESITSPAQNVPQAEEFRQVCQLPPGFLRVNPVEVGEESEHLLDAQVLVQSGARRNQAYTTLDLVGTFRRGEPRDGCPA